ncbi:hypothetical protein AB0F91_43745 [Amycolatopsis sp. NPDC023774]|uniref:hypothetical protein n=1 Tax=Amycolatopsis sp. NPDC023774 TaxID=3155015 RepID=UPI0033FD2399
MPIPTLTWRGIEQVAEREPVGSVWEQYLATLAPVTVLRSLAAWLLTVELSSLSL